jgi:E3 ubiquitin-protein ligase HERC2
MRDIPGKRVVSLAVGSVHVLALTEEGEVYGWGRNDYAQVGETSGSSVLEPTLITSLQGKVIIGIACGPTQVLLVLVVRICYSHLISP